MTPNSERFQFDDYRRVLPAPPSVGHPWCDSSTPPMYRTVWPESSSEEEIQAYMDAVVAWVERLRSPWVTSLDFSRFNAGTSSPEQRRVFIDGAKKILGPVGDHCAGVTVIAPSALVRGVITAVQWFVTPPCPVSLVASRAEAETWAAAQLMKAAEGWHSGHSGGLGD